MKVPEYRARSAMKK